MSQKGVDPKVRAERMKQFLEEKYHKMREDREATAARREDLESAMDKINLTEGKRKEMRTNLSRIEAVERKEARKRVTTDDFHSLILIGRGAFGEVRLVKKRDTGEVLALKAMIKEAMVLKNQAGHVQAERDVLSIADNPWIVKLNYSFQDSINLFMLMEYLPGGDLMGLLMKQDTFSEEISMQYMAELTSAVMSIHSLGYIHRDLKPDNVLIDWSGHIKLTDMGLCKKLDLNQDVSYANPLISASDTSSVVGSSPNLPSGLKQHHKLAYSTVGTPDYIAPEVLQSRGYSSSVDYWSLGIILYECLIGYTPFYSQEAVITCRKILRFQSYFEIPATSNLSPDVIDLLLSLICDGDTRLTGPQVLQHAWFRPLAARLPGGDWNQLRNLPIHDFAGNSSSIQSALAELRSMTEIDTSTLRVKRLLRQITSNFDEFEDGNNDMSTTHGRQVNRKDKDYQFLGYTYTRQRERLRAMMTQELFQRLKEMEDAQESQDR